MNTSPNLRPRALRTIWTAHGVASSHSIAPRNNGLAEASRSQLFCGLPGVGTGRLRASEPSTGPAAYARATAGDVGLESDLPGRPRRHRAGRGLFLLANKAPEAHHCATLLMGGTCAELLNAKVSLLGHRASQLALAHPGRPSRPSTNCIHQTVRPQPILMPDPPITYPDAVAIASFDLGFPALPNADQPLLPPTLDMNFGDPAEQGSTNAKPSSRPP